MSHRVLPLRRAAAHAAAPVWLRLVGLLVLLGTFPQRAWAAFGLYQDYAIVNVNGSGNVYYAGGRNADNAPNIFQGQAFGAFVAGQTLVLGSELKTFKNNGTNVTGGRLYYRVYLATATPGSFIQTNPAFSDNLNNGNGDQKWTNVSNSQGQNTPTPVNLLTGLTTGNYILEVYWTAQADNSADVVDDNNGTYYRATFSYSEPLPVALTAFTAQRQGADALLNWATASETNNAGYEVQVSTDGLAFRVLGFVAPAAATSQVPHSYTFLDREEAKAGLRHYRLRQVDLNGTFAYSPVRTVQFGARPAAYLAAAPNPFSSSLTLRMELPEASSGPAALLLTDAMGRIVLRQDLGTLPAGPSQTALSATGALPAGLYLARLVLPTGTQVARVLKE